MAAELSAKRDFLKIVGGPSFLTARQVKSQWDTVRLSIFPPPYGPFFLLLLLSPFSFLLSHVSFLLSHVYFLLLIRFDLIIIFSILIFEY